MLIYDTGKYLTACNLNDFYATCAGIAGADIAPNAGEDSFSILPLLAGEVYIRFLLPVTAMALFIFQWYAVKQLAICIISCLVAEALFTKMRRQPLRLDDFSAAINAVKNA